MKISTCPILKTRPQRRSAIAVLATAVKDYKNKNTFACGHEMMVRLIFVLALGVCTLAAEQGGEQQPQSPNSENAAKKFKRRVMLMVFLNESRDANKEYLGVSVADAFSAPLVRTGNFVILNRDSVGRYMKAMSIPHDDVFKVENATRLGKAIGADVVVVGKFSGETDSVLIEARAVDVQAGLVSVEDSQQIKTNASMFIAINRLAERMSGPMAEKMKPLETAPPPAEVVLDEKQVAEEVKKIEEKKELEKPPEDKPSLHCKLALTARVGAALGVGLGYTNSVYPIGFGVAVAGEVRGISGLFFKQEWLKNFEFGLLAGYFIYPSKNPSYENLSQIPLHASVGYRFALPWLQGIAVTPLVSAGMNFGKFSNVNGTASYRIFAWSAGGRAEYALTDRWSVALTTLVLFEYDQGLNYQWVNFLSAGVRW